MGTFTTSGSPRLPSTGPLGLLQRARLDEHLPVDRRLSRVYRIGAGLVGLGLVIFGALGITENLDMFSTGDDTIWGLNTNGALSWLSIVVGLVLFFGMVRGGNLASTLNMLIGAAFVLSGFVNLALLETGANVLNFRMSNVIFSFAAGLLLMSFGMYGRVSGRLPHDNPYWRVRHPEAGEDAPEREKRAEHGRRVLDERQRDEAARSASGAVHRGATDRHG
ncbi:DUF4383 domain-containing protein [Streptomyces marincola]|uniref:DUF4383 domain-containing protein n=1 Tax=Streptomyces marincola TaxID=2878388 RepID=A0A1W7D226_9ACTN|nr:DUF4383 domain-containing protein [Streptomyces marincola]ARQ71007.1 DUF4383 domain-containing protein [Streptomyces marincola]